MAKEEEMDLQLQCLIRYLKKVFKKEKELFCKMLDKHIRSHEREVKGKRRRESNVEKKRKKSKKMEREKERDKNKERKNGKKKK